MHADKYYGVVSIIGKPNVGKSTILNKILEQKICITSRKPQTTRHRILGIYTNNKHQIVFVDTPGIHTENKKSMNKIMNKNAFSVIKNVEAVLFVVDCNNWDNLDENAIAKIAETKDSNTKKVLIINKIDKIADKRQLLPFIKSIEAKLNFDEVIPVSAKSGQNINKIIETSKKYTYQSEHCFPEDMVTDKPAKFIVSEIIREKIIRHTGDELPYAVNVEIENFKIMPNETYNISALITIEKDSQKAMVIGKKGNKIKMISTAARKDIEIMLGNKVFLNIWVKTKKGWKDNKAIIESLGK